MKRFLGLPLGLLVLALILGVLPGRAYTQHTWRVVSPEHGQTFAYGSEQRKVWTTRGTDNHLALMLTYTNDPYVDRNNPRQYDYFTLGFPQITLGADGMTFYYHTPDKRSIAVARKKADFVGIKEIHLLPNAYLVIKKPHGYLTLTLVVADFPFPSDAN